MARRVNLDAMIPREDFGMKGDDAPLELIRDFPISNLESGSPLRMLLRKPDFQRETNHWSPEQIATFVASFLDNEVIPSLIPWKSPSFIFVIDGGHRLSALRAWIEDDYGDGAVSHASYNGEISTDQKRVARRTRQLLDDRVGRFLTLRGLVGNRAVGSDGQARRIGLLFTRALSLQWVTGTPEVAETSFFKINSQGTPLDETEQLLIKYRRKPIAISARAILRSGAGHKYWSAYSEDRQARIESISGELFKLLFEPEISSPVRTLDIPLGGSVSPVDALSLLIAFLTVACSSDQNKIKGIADYEDDITGDATIEVLTRALNIIGRIVGNESASMGCTPQCIFTTKKARTRDFFFLEWCC